MKSKKTAVTGVIASICFIVLILDSRTVLAGAKDGMEMVLRTVIPALFPFMVVTTVLNKLMIGRKIPVLRWIGTKCGIPDGAESVFLLGLLSGYPVGAKTVFDTYLNGHIEQRTARRLLGFCNNAGPAFIFGIIGAAFRKSWIAFVLWGVHILSAMIVGLILPEKNNQICNIETAFKTDFTAVLKENIKTMAVVASWIVIWRTTLSVVSTHFLFKLPVTVKVIITGFFELTNGCLALNSLTNESVRFIVASCFLACGGLCIGMQTRSVTGALGTGMYFSGKVLQTIIAFALSGLISYGIYPLTTPMLMYIPIIAAMMFIVGTILIFKQKNNGSISLKNVV